MGIREAYRTYLGRDASDEEVANWESGVYGYNNQSERIDAIRNSGEAQAYAARSQGGGGGGNETQGGGGDGGGGESEQGPTPTNTDPDPNPDPNPGGTGGNPSAPVDEAQDPVLRAQVKTAYKTHLLRDASDAEVTAWLDGSNGWGKGKAGINRIIQGIANSGEAKAAQPRYDAAANAANPGQAGRTAYQNTDWWARQGVNTDDIIDAATGQLKPGWERFSGGIRRAPGAANMGRLLGFDQTNYTNATSANPTMNSVKYGFAQIANRYPPTPTGLQQLLQDPEFKNRFPGATLVGHDSIDFGNLLSDGATGTRVGIVDVGQMFDKGANTGKGWWWGPVGSGTTTTTSTTPTATTPAASAAATARGFTASGGGSPLMNPAATAGPMGMGMGGGGGYGGGGYGGGGYGGGNMGSGITPYNPLANYNPEPYNAPAPFTPPAYEGATPFSRPEYASAQPFTGLSVDEMNADPGYQFRMQQGQQALERSGAAKGVTNTGGNLRDILDYGQQAGSQEYGAAYGRKLNDYTTNEQNRFNTYQTNYANAMGAYNQNEANRAGAFDRNVGNAANAYNTNAENAYRQYTTNTAGQNMANQEAEARRSGAYNTNLGAYENQQQYGLRSQAQAYDQQYRNWVEQYNQGRQNATDTYNRMYGLI